MHVCVCICMYLCTRGVLAGKSDSLSGCPYSTLANLKPWTLTLRVHHRVTMYSGILLLCIAITGGVVYGSYILGVNLCSQPLNLHRHVMAQDLRLQICEHGTGSYTCGEDPIDQTPFHYAGPQLSYVIDSKHPHMMV